jgi:AraC-like DNA-binding protein
MAKLAQSEPSDVPGTHVLARAIRRFAQSDGDHNTVIPALTLHRRSAPSEPLHCIYNLGLGVVAQGDKKILLGSEAQIAKAVAWLKQNFVEALRGDDLADRAHMSPSTFRQHFRALTGLSPLQYQKQLRLQEARQLMLNQNLDAGSAAGRVGYESASQFSREYNRLFGAPPQRDIKRMRVI